ncbi:hypothetical protein BO70DRAFT_377746 [Aspergillus heteromorphus CBS 117.55]|uniref:Uncharacterized protein n=1 Tax=Aspergillus heteromorphus CBS 117.55 TaxID=1448321 RepID=A0A317WV69_9EURO|nr:uncharacterized protein BO70DRAFT_377746 [Aspergillus heteromorphus CBS 117.55]PWY88170.1 hypothetical protein BO70DRAFT_377746 [Aspergillus heteromorphus CBS 117.55]
MNHLRNESDLGYRKVDDSTEGAPRPRPLSSSNPLLLRPRTPGAWGAGWTWEIVSCVIAVAALIAIIAILYNYDGKPMPDWPYGITLNALVSLLVTVMKAAMVFPITEGLSQLKWSWFNESNKLSDLSLLDAASRGAVSATFVLFKFVPRHLVSIGCFILVVAAAIAPFVQQVLTTKPQPIQTPDQSSIRVCNTSTYVDYAEGAGPGMNKAPLSTMGAIYTGLFQSEGPNSDSVAITCPTGNCTFAPYQSLGFCSRCANITSDLTLAPSSTDSTTETYSYNLTNGLSFTTSYSSMYLMNATTDLDLIQLTTDGLPVILNFTAISAAGYGVPPQVSATECALYFCTKTYEASVQRGSFNETLTSTATTTNSSSTDVTSNIFLTPQTCYTNGTQTSNTSACTYDVSWLSQLAMSNSISPLLQGTGSLFVSNRPSWSSDTIEAAYGTYGNYTDLNTMFDSLASSLTMHARSSVCAASITGTTWTVESFVHVQWPWLTLPVVLLVLTLVFLVTTVIRTRNQFIWKSSPLALLFSDLAVEAPHAFERSPDLSLMEEASRRMTVFLETTAGGAKLKAVLG